MARTRHRSVLQLDNRRGRRRWSSGALPILLPLALAGTGITLAQQPVVLAKVEVRLVALGYRVSGFLGERVITRRGNGRQKRLFIIGGDKGLLTIISTSGFLSIVDRKVAIPYSSLKISPSGILLPGGNKAAVNSLPEFHRR